MKLCTYRVAGATGIGVVVDGEVTDLGAVAGGALPREMRELLRGGWLGESADVGAVRRVIERGRVPTHPLDDVELLAPVPRPGKIVGIGRNYAEHAAEVGGAPRAVPRLFLKAPTSVIGPRDDIVLPEQVRKLDYEVELAVVIGRSARRVTPADALATVAGYCVLNDVSARDYQFDMGDPMTSLAKSMDTFCPLGPWIVTPDEVAEPEAITLRCWVNGELRQQDSTASLIVDIPSLISYISGFMTLEPGDVIATGTPAGVGLASNPPTWLRPRDVVTCEASGLGSLTNQVRASG